MLIGDVVTNIYGSIEKPEAHYHSDDDNREQKEREKVLQWIAPAEDDVRFQALIHRNARDSQKQGTGAWFLDGQSFMQWRSGEIQFVWLYGGGKHDMICTVVTLT